jgi:hypothetical protein
MKNQLIDTIITTNKSVIPHKFNDLLNNLLSRCQVTVKEMLKDRKKKSSKNWKSVPCVVAKSLINKYQKNKKCKSVRNCVIPVCGDKGKQIKISSNDHIRIPAIFGKSEIKIDLLKPLVYRFS